ncbi:MAG: OsmC family peroxiredoxin [Chloroflexi bacterium]|nr:OsmC family peroxiredoxin [Chloroflexota bacterium]
MAIRTSEATWTGNLREGKGVMKIGKDAYNGPFTHASRFESGEGTNPEELIGAAHAGCYSMFLSAVLTKAGFPPKSIHTTATVHLTDGPTISLIELNCVAEVPGVDEKLFLEQSEVAKKGCPVSKALAGVDIKLTASLKH